jgi:hypothetical protein
MMTYEMSFEKPEEGPFVKKARPWAVLKTGVLKQFRPSLLDKFVMLL